MPSLPIEEKNYWLAFSAFPGIGPLRFKLLVDYFGSAQKAWEAEGKKLLDIGLGEKLTAKFISFRQKFSIKEFNQFLEKNEIQTFTLLDKKYPPLLSQIPAAPFVLYVRGKTDSNWWNNGRTVAVVGTRRVTGYGTAVTKRITEGLAGMGLTIVSGMAYGVDTVAHQAAIDAGGKTIAVLGCGIDMIHPISNTALYWNIIKKFGAVVSEFPPGVLVSKGLFPARNRIISGLSQGVVVTEGAKDSGALITARFAAEQGREVFAVPGPITSELSQGPTILLKQGAKMVTEVTDILEELNIKNMTTCLAGRRVKQCNNETMRKIFNNLTPDEKKIMEILENENLHFDEIVRKSGVASSKIGSLLTMMEMKSLIKHLGGGIYGINS